MPTAGEVEAGGSLGLSANQSSRIVELQIWYKIQSERGRYLTSNSALHTHIHTLHVPLPLGRAHSC